MDDQCYGFKYECNEFQYPEFKCEYIYVTDEPTVMYDQRYGVKYECNDLLLHSPVLSTDVPDIGLTVVLDSGVSSDNLSFHNADGVELVGPMNPLSSLSSEANAVVQLDVLMQRAARLNLRNVPNPNLRFSARHRRLIPADLVESDDEEDDPSPTAAPANDDSIGTPEDNPDPFPDDCLWDGGSPPAGLPFFSFHQSEATTSASLTSVASHLSVGIDASTSFNASIFSTGAQLTFSEQPNPTRAGVTNHKQRKHGAPCERIKCDECEYTAINRARVTIHKQRKHGAPCERIKCDECEYTALTRAEVTIHKQRKHGAPCERIKCDECEYSAITRAGVASHKKYKHGANCERIKYDGCEYTAVTRPSSLTWRNITCVCTICLRLQYVKEIGNCNECKLHDVDS